MKVYQRWANVKTKSQAPNLTAGFGCQLYNQVAVEALSASFPICKRNIT